MLTLPQALLLFATDEKGRDALAGGSHLAPQLAASVLMELGMRGALTLRGEDLGVRDPLPTGHLACDTVLSTLCELGGRGAMEDCLEQVLLHDPHLPDLVTQELIDLGFVYLRNRRIYRTFRLRPDAPQDPTGEVALLKALRRANAARAEVDDRLACLACVLRVSDLSGIVFPYCPSVTANASVERLMEACPTAVPWTRAVVSALCSLRQRRRASAEASDAVPPDRADGAETPVPKPARRAQT